MTNEKDIQNVINQDPPLREEVERELRVRAWKDEAFRQELIANPKGVIERLFPQCFPDGKVPDEVTYKVIVEDAYTHHILLPALRDELTSQMSQERQEEIITNMGCQDLTWSIIPCTRLMGTCTCTCNCTRGCSLGCK